MNAKQIADELENIYWIQGDGKGKPFQQYADFVRQQQAQIEALKKEAALQRLSDFTQEAEKTLTDEEDTECQYCKQGCIRCDARKLLTDEEIKQVWQENLVTMGNDLDFARAILRKANEK